MTDHLPVPYDPADEPFRVTTGPLEVTHGPAPANPAYPRPDFVMWGVREPGRGVLLFVTTDMSQAQLVSEVERLDLIPVGRALARVPVTKTTLHVEMHSFTMIRANSYPEALMSLRDNWRPPET